MLTDPSSPIGDNLGYPFVVLAEALKNMGHQVATIDTDDLKKFDAVVFVEFPGRNNHYFKPLVASGFSNMHAILLESPLVKPDNYDIANHRYFKTIFTWDDNLIDGKKYFKVQYAHKIPANPDFGTEKKKLCTNISSNKSPSNDPRQLYSERIKAIRWFEQNHPEDFDLWGKGWDRKHFDGTFLGFKLARLNRLTWLAKLLAQHYPSYRGPVASKHQTLKNYQFAICYENARDVKGYITEKIMDCFLAGCVPIYLGAPNITDYIPAGTFVDFRRFSQYGALYDYLKNMPAAEYEQYMAAIKDFLTGEIAKPFSADYFAKTIINGILQ